MEEPAPIAIDVQNLSKFYGKKEKAALADISLQIPVGTIACLLGPNGSGKTTLLKTLCGLLEPSEGSISIMGRETKADPRAARSYIGWMPAEERSGFYGRLTGRQNLGFFAALHGAVPPESDRIIGNLALLLDLGEDLDQSVLKTSAGAKQKTGLARTLLNNPPVLLLDEPFRNLDPHTILRLRRLLKNNLTRVQKKTVLLSTHQLEEARQVADLIIILNKGRIVKKLTARELDNELRNSSVENFYIRTIDSAEEA